MTSAVLRDLEDIRRRDARLADSALAALAIVLAGELDNPANKGTAKSMVAARLHEALDRLRELSPPEQEADAFDDLASRRAARRAGGATA